MNEEVLTVVEVNFMKHALGLKKRNSHSYRNYFCGKDDIGESLVSKGLATSRIPESTPYTYYYISENGIELLRKYIGYFKVLN